MEKKSKDRVHDHKFGWIRRPKSALSRVPGQQVQIQIHFQVSRDLARVVKCMVK
jgi:hypothetical protein